MTDPKTPATPEVPPEPVVLPEEMREKETDPKNVEINKNITS